MIKILPAKRSEVFAWNEDEWLKVNENHFGPGVKWNTTKFYFKAEQDGEILGLIFGKHESGTTYVSNIIVKESERRQGIGTQLMKRAEQFGKKFNDHKIWLITGAHYPEDPFFTSLGFKKEVDLKDWYFHRDFVVYAKEIERK